MDYYGRRCLSNVARNKSKFINSGQKRNQQIATDNTPLLPVYWAIVIKDKHALIILSLSISERYFLSLFAAIRFCKAFSWTPGQNMRFVWANRKRTRQMKKNPPENLSRTALVLSFLIIFDIHWNFWIGSIVHDLSISDFHDSPLYFIDWYWILETLKLPNLAITQSIFSKILQHRPSTGHPRGYVMALWVKKIHWFPVFRWLSARL